MVSLVSVHCRGSLFDIYIYISRDQGYHLPAIYNQIIPAGPGQGRAGQGRAGQGRAGQGRAGQGRAGQGRAGQGRAGQDSNLLYTDVVNRPLH